MGVEVLLYSFMTTALEGSEGSASRPGRFLPLGKTRCPLYRRLGGAQDRSGQVWKISPPPGFDPQTVQPVAGHYTDWATRPTDIEENVISVVYTNFPCLPELIQTQEKLKSRSTSQLILSLGQTTGGAVSENCVQVYWCTVIRYWHYYKPAQYPVNLWHDK